LPWQIVVGPKGIANGIVELKNRATGERSELPFDEALKRFAE
jgi:prolyl-tRNA synthetase